MPSIIRPFTAGFGLMNLTWRPNPPPQDQSFAVLSAALSSSATLWNSATFYGPPTDPTANLTLINNFLTKNPSASSEITLMVKGCVDPATLVSMGSASAVRRSAETAVAALGGRKIDIFQPARIDQTVPLSETMDALIGCIDAGLIDGIGLSEAGPATIRRAHAMHPLAAVEVEISIWSREVFAPGGVAETCRELGIPIVAYSPLGRGMLAGAVKSISEIPEGDMRRHLDRFQEGNFDVNRILATEIARIAEGLDVTPAQLCLQWVKWMGKRFGVDIVAVPGATTVERVRENYQVPERDWDAALQEVESVFEKVGVKGGRYNDHAESQLLV